MCEQEVSAAAIKKVDKPDPQAFIAPDDGEEEATTEQQEQSVGFGQ